MADESELMSLVDTAARHPFYASCKDAVRWEEVPRMTREILQATPLRKRLFVDWSDVEIVRPTSGTSGKGVLVVPRARSQFDLTSSLQQGVYREHSITRLATFSAGQPHFADTYAALLGIQSIVLDPGDLQLSHQLALSFEPDMLAGPAYALERFASMLAPATRARIRAVQLFGEKVSDAGWAELRAAFPDAQIFTEYAMIETQASAGAPCSDIRSRGEPYFHMIPGASHIELTDESGSVLEREGASGELVVTTTRPSAVLLLRYRTGDQGRIVRSTCACGNGPVFAAEGRLEIDRIRIHGGEINVAELDRVVASLAPRLVSQEYEARYSEEDGTGQLTIALDCERPESLIEAVSRALRIAPRLTYAEHAQTGSLKPLRLERYAPQAKGKRRRLIRV